MFRSTAVVLLFAFLPSFSFPQDTPQVRQVTHEVVKGETLWGLAERYLGNPYRWPMIYEANSDQIEDPDLIEPGQVFVIPGIGGEVDQVGGGEVAQVSGVAVVRQVEVPVLQPEQAQPAQPAPVQARSGEWELCPGINDRTLFYTGARGTRRCPPPTPLPSERTPFYSPGSSDAGLLGAAPRVMALGPAPAATETERSVPWGIVYSAEWLRARGEDTGSIGIVAALSNVHAERTPRGPAREGESVVLIPNEGIQLRTGDLVQAFRLDREDPKLGAVLEPTGILVVTGESDAGVLARVSEEFDRIQVGDDIRKAPDYDPRAGAAPTEVASNVTGAIIGFAEKSQIQGFGSRIFLEVDADAGVEIGDIFQAQVEEPGPLFGMEASELQVVLVDRNRVTARVVAITHPGLEEGRILRLVAKIQ